MIYKYAPFSKFTLENITKCQVSCRHFSQFNDPFEFWSIIERGEPHPDVDPLRYQRALKAWDFETSYSEDVRDYFEEIRGYQLDFDQVFKGVRISCFARQPDNLLMWSHYADGLRGVCLEFDEERLIANNTDAQMIDVHYSEKPDYVDAFEYALANDQIWYCEVAYEETKNKSYLDERPRLWDIINRTIVAAFATKPIEWQYERECRLIIQSDMASDLQFHAYPIDALKRIIVGQRAREEDLQQLEQAISATGASIPIAEASCVRDRYRLEITDATSRKLTCAS